MLSWTVTYSENTPTVAIHKPLLKIFMNILRNIICLTLFLTLFACRNNAQMNQRNIQSVITDTTTIKDENTENIIDYDNTKVIREVYVIDRTGTEIKQRADKNSKTIGTYEFGAKLDVIEETDDWLGVRERITKEYLKNGNIIESTDWEKVYVLKSKTGSINEIILVPKDLNIISSLTINKKTENFETGVELKDFLKIELIDKFLFDNKRSSAVNFLLADTTRIKKQHGIIELKCKAKVKKYIDKPYAEENMQVFYYLGQFEFLNKYLINCSYYEGSDYRFIDKTSGEETHNFGAYPHISADKKHIICIYTNPYETTADLELYSIEDKQIKHKMSARFKNWMPTIEHGEMFWSTDGYLYLTVNHVNSFWKPDGNLNDKCQYIRIKIL